MLIMALTLSFVVKTWVVQAFYIPSGSMEETLQVRDRVIVSKMTPDVVDVHRGDVIVFRDPGDWLAPQPAADYGPVLNGVRSTLTFVGLLPDAADEHLIKRVVGIGGDQVRCCDAQDRLVVNDVPLEEPYLYPGDTASSLTFDITVPRGSVWVMGDHRSNSQDSRFHPVGGDGTSGSVPVDLVTGRAIAVIWPLNHLGILSRPDDVAELGTNASP